MDVGKKNAADFEVMMLAYETVLICSYVLAFFNGQYTAISTDFKLLQCNDLVQYRRWLLNLARPMSDICLTLHVMFKQPVIAENLSFITKVLH